MSSFNIFVTKGLYKQIVEELKGTKELPEMWTISIVAVD